MITEKEFKNINDKIIEAINEAYTIIEPKPDYIVYLADGEYKKKLVKNSLNLSPYVIDDREDFMADQTRNKFMIEFLNTFYRFGAVKTVDDSEIRINME